MSNSNSNSNSNPRDSVNNSSNVSRSLSPYGDPVLHQYDAMGAQTHDQGYGQDLNLHQSSMFDRLDLNAPNGASRFRRPSTPAFVYIVTSHFTSQTTSDGVRLSESDIVGFQILAVFARLEDANAYAEQEFEEIDAGVRRRRRRRPRDRGAVVEEGEGVNAETSVDEDGAMSWLIESVGRIEVGRWVVQ